MRRWPRSATRCAPSCRSTTRAAWSTRWSWLIQRRRLQEAAELLRGRPAGLGEVSAALGYADQAHFTRDFARVTGTTPGRFAAVHAAGG